jgi:dihydrofolate reductase
MIRLIAAIDRQKGIAKQGVQPWKIPEDEDYFKNQTSSLGGKVLTGSTTFKTAYGNHPLEGRQNFILTHSTEPIEGAVVVNDLMDFLNQNKGQDIWVAGGANVYKQLIENNCADELYLTFIDADFGCDQFFPDFEDKFDLEKQGELQEQNGFNFRYNLYVKKK